jgi:hypothetical protein
MSGDVVGRPSSTIGAGAGHQSILAATAGRGGMVADPATERSVTAKRKNDRRSKAAVPQPHPAWPDPATRTPPGVTNSPVIRAPKGS